MKRDNVPNSKEEEARLIEQVAAGDPEAVDRFLASYEGTIFNFAFRMCGQQQDAEDTAQETMITALRYLPNFRGESKLSSWLYRIASSICIKSRTRGPSVKEELLSIEQYFQDREGGAEALAIPDPDSDVLDRALGEEVQKRVREEISRLPKIYRLTLVLRDLEGLTTKEAAEVLEISEENVKQRLHRARLQIKKGLETFWVDRQSNA